MDKKFKGGLLMGEFKEAYQPKEAVHGKEKNEKMPFTPDPDLSYLYLT